MAVYLQPIDRHRIEIFSAVPLGSYVIYDLWSAGSSVQGHTLQWATVFFHIIYYQSQFSEKNLLCNKLFVLFSLTYFFEIFLL